MCVPQCLQTAQLALGHANISQLLFSASVSACMWWNLAKWPRSLKLVDPDDDCHPTSKGKTRSIKHKIMCKPGEKLCYAKPALAKRWMVKQMIELSIKPRGWYHAVMEHPADNVPWFKMNSNTKSNCKMSSLWCQPFRWPFPRRHRWGKVVE